MFNIGPLEFVVLAAVALIVFGPDKLPQLTKDAARMIKSLREMAQGARTQLTEELGPEFANLDLASLNPRTAIQKALLGDGDLSEYNPRQMVTRAMNGDPEIESPGRPNLTKSASSSVPSDISAQSVPLAADERPPFDPDTT